MLELDAIFRGGVKDAEQLSRNVIIATNKRK
jgi:hypothetical protein